LVILIAAVHREGMPQEFGLIDADANRQRCAYLELLANSKWFGYDRKSSTFLKARIVARRSEPAATDFECLIAESSQGCVFEEVKQTENTDSIISYDYSTCWFSN
jgi:hypothetical protein